MDQGFKERIIFGFAFLLLAAVSLAVFYPSFAHTFRSDQIVYFANTRNYSDVISLWRNYYAYEHVRYYYPGDAFLFRPLLAVLLGFEKGVFGMHYAYWHILGFFLHMLTVWFVFRILYDLKAGIFAFLGALFYACCYANVEIVIWEHINGYVLFNALVMASLFYLKRSFDDKRRQNLWYVFLFLMISSFLHEWGCLFALIFGICFYFKNIETRQAGENRKMWLFFVPGFFYALAYSWVNGHYQADNLTKLQADQFFKIIQFSNVLHVIGFIPRFLYHLIVSGLFPSLFNGELNRMDRLVFVPSPAFTAIFALNTAAVCGLVYFILKGLSREVTARHKFYILLLIGMVMAILITLPLMRLPTHGEQYVLQTSSYYGYLFWGYFLIIIFMMIDWVKVNLQGRPQLKYLAAVSLGILILLNAHQTWALNQSIKKSRNDWKQYIDKLNGFIAIHGREKGFSFFIYNDRPIMLGHKVDGLMQEQINRLDLASILYYPYYDPQHPKYIFLRKNGSIQ